MNCNEVKILNGGFVMSKESGMGSKKNFSKKNKGMGKCMVGSHGEQCGRGKEIAKGKHVHFEPIEPVNPMDE